MIGPVLYFFGKILEQNDHILSFSLKKEESANTVSFEDEIIYLHQTFTDCIFLVII